MSMQSLKHEIVAAVRVVLNNPKMRVKDLLAWSNGTNTPNGPDEIEIKVRAIDMNWSCIVPKSCDKRKK